MLQMQPLTTKQSLPQLAWSTDALHADHDKKKVRLHPPAEAVAEAEAAPALTAATATATATPPCVPLQPHTVTLYTMPLASTKHTQCHAIVCTGMLSWLQ